MDVEVDVTEFWRLKPGQKFKMCYPGAPVSVKCKLGPAAEVLEKTKPDWLGWAVRLEDGQLNEWEADTIVIVVE